MKVIALIPAKNEEGVLPICLSSLKDFVDEIVVYDDHSNDKTSMVAKQFGARVITENYTSSAGWPEYQIRERLLSEARALEGTHFISLDADEAVTTAFAKEARNFFTKMKPGESIALRWITLWKEQNQERVDGVFSDLYKEFAFCDDKTSHHKYAFLGVGRVPQSEQRPLTIPPEFGGILHFQYVLWEKTQMKQAWYRCSELIKAERSIRRINHTYSSTLDNAHIQLKTTPDSWHVQVSSDIYQSKVTDTWQYKQIITWFNEFGLLKFEGLQIWHIPELHKLFIEKEGREPRIQVFPNWLVTLNKVRHYLRI